MSGIQKKYVALEIKYKGSYCTNDCPQNCTSDECLLFGTLERDYDIDGRRRLRSAKCIKQSNKFIDLVKKGGMENERINK